MNVALTAENIPACAHQNSVSYEQSRSWVTHEDERRVQIFVVFLCIITVKVFGLFAIDCEEVGSGVLGPWRLEEFFEGGLETVSKRQ